MATNLFGITPLVPDHYANCSVALESLDSLIEYRCQADVWVSEEPAESGM